MNFTSNRMVKHSGLIEWVWVQPSHSLTEWARFRSISRCKLSPLVKTSGNPVRAVHTHTILGCVQCPFSNLNSNMNHDSKRNYKTQNINTIRGAPFNVENLKLIIRRSSLNSPLSKTNISVFFTCTGSYRCESTFKDVWKLNCVQCRISFHSRSWRS